MAFPLEVTSIVIALCLAMIGLMELGRRLGVRRWARQPDSARAGLGAVEGSVFALMGLLVAFTFSGAAGRFDARRQQIVQEANDIGTAYLRLDLLAEPDRADLKQMFREYLDARLATYAAMPDYARALSELDRSNAMQGKIWARIVPACEKRANPATTSLVLSATNAMFDICATRVEATKLHPPSIVYILLFATGLLCSLLAGFGMAGAPAGSGKPPPHRSWVHMIVFGATMAATMYVIIDLEYPRLGFIRMDAADKVLYDLRAGMK